MHFPCDGFFYLYRGGFYNYIPISDNRYTSGGRFFIVKYYSRRSYIYGGGLYIVGRVVHNYGGRLYIYDRELHIYGGVFQMHTYDG